MVPLIAAALLIFGYAVAQDADCDFRQNVGASERYYINSPNYPNNYSAGRTCRYIAVCPTGYNCRLDCNVVMPLSTGCTQDRLLISMNGDPTLTGADAYCGTRTVSAVSLGGIISMGLFAPQTSRGGRFSCTLSAQLAPTVTPPPASCRCGERKRNRIVGGQETRVNEYTMMAGLIEVAVRSIYCGAVIISSKYVMTAAHCLNNFRQRPNALEVTVGDHYINDDRSGTRHAVARFIIHEYFNPTTYDYDIGLVEVIREIQFNDNVQPVCLPFKYTNSNLTGRNVTMLGWGTTSLGGPTSDVLLKVDVTVISQASCSATESNITNRQLCAFTRGKDACQYDSGGPLLYPDPNNGLEFVVAAVSYGNGCGTLRPSVNTRVTDSELLRWVINNANSRFCMKQ